MAEMLPPESLERLATTFRILADASRLAILHSLIQHGELSVGQIVAATGRHQANVSKHLKSMAEANLLARRKTGLQVFYALADPVWEQFFQAASNLLLTERTD